MNTADQAPRSIEIQASPAGTPLPGVRRGDADRVRHLFRVLTRAGLVHPLQHLLMRYRAGERA